MEDTLVASCCSWRTIEGVRSSKAAILDRHFPGSGSTVVDQREFGRGERI